MCLSKCIYIRTFRFNCKITFGRCDFFSKSFSLSIIIFISYRICTGLINLFWSTIFVQFSKWSTMLVLSRSTMFVQTYRLLFHVRQSYIYICKGPRVPTTIIIDLWKLCPYLLLIIQYTYCLCWVDWIDISRYFAWIFIRSILLSCCF